MTYSNSDAIEHVINARPRDIGGFEVARALPYAKRRTVGPFIFFDRMGPAEFGPGEGIDVRPHPHIGLATATYLFDGEIMHRDDLGYEQPIRPGDVNWMTAGRGIVHSERTRAEVRDSHSTMFGIQSWVALPKDQEEADPAFFYHPANTLPAISRDGVEMRLIAGTAYGETSPVATASPMFYVDVRMDTGTSLEVTDEHGRTEAWVEVDNFALTRAGAAPAQPGPAAGRWYAPGPVGSAGGPSLEPDHEGHRPRGRLGNAAASHHARRGRLRRHRRAALYALRQRPAALFGGQRQRVRPYLQGIGRPLRGGLASEP